MLQQSLGGMDILLGRAEIARPQGPLCMRRNVPLPLVKPSELRISWRFGHSSDSKVPPKNARQQCRGIDAEMVSLKWI